MKKILLMLSVCLLGAPVLAQRKMRFEVKLLSPAIGATITAGTPFDQQMVIKNLGPDVIDAADTLVWADPASGSAPYRLTGYTKAMGDTIQLNRSYKLSAGKSGTISYCVVAAVVNAKNPILFDTTGFRACNDVTIAGGTGIGDPVFEKIGAAGQLNIIPNPAATTVSFDYVAINNAEVMIRICDVTGRTVQTHNFGKAFPGQKDFRLDISGLMTGMYFIEIRQDQYRALGKLSRL